MSAQKSAPKTFSDTAVQRYVRRMVVPVISRWRTGPKRVVREWAADFGQRLSRQPHQLHFFYDASDPYSHLAALLVPRLERAYRLQLNVVLVPPPDDAHAPERKRLTDWSVRDVRDIAPFYGLKVGTWRAPPPRPQQRLAQRALVAAGEKAAADLADISTDLWGGRTRALSARPQAAVRATEEALAAGGALRTRWGHYSGAMFYYGGTWYWGLDRLSYLTARLDWHQLRRAGAPPALPRVPHTPRLPKRSRRAKPAGKASAPPFTLECFVSLRSPYSYIALPELLALARHYPLRLRARPVLPMVMRGLPVPPTKGVYILEDVAREALTNGVPFGRVQDPVGTPVRRGMSLFPFADAQGRGMEWLHAFCHAAWARARYMGDEKNLRAAASSIGLAWNEAREHLDQPGWEAVAERNQKALFELGLWGVPSFRLSNQRNQTLYSGFGRDRIWRIRSILAGGRS